jgi:hypothetical protein
MAVAVKVIGSADGGKNPHAGKFVAAWNPHTRAGTLELSSTTDPKRALTFAAVEEALIEWNTVSRVQTVRPWDNRPNKPLTGVTVELVDLPK